MSSRGSWLAAGLIALAVLAPVRGRAEEPPYLVKDIFPGRDPNAKSNPGGFVVLGDVALFSADDGEHGYELWRTDGSAEGTVLVKDIAPGPISGLSVPASILPISTDVAVFAAYDAEHGIELWRSDGTEDGTMLIKDINPGTASSVYYPSLFFWNGSVYFSATDEASGAELWKTDATPGGTVQVADINPGPASSTPGGFTASGDTLFFVADDGVHGCELWGTDGTAAGTRLVKDTDPATQCDIMVGYEGRFHVHVAPTSLTDVDGTLFFTTDNALWKSDGTAAGTVTLRSFSGFCSGFEVFACPPTCLTNVGGTLYFQAEDHGSGREPWRSDGTPEGTILLKDINPSPCVVDGTGFDHCSSDPCGFHEEGEEILFSAAEDGRHLEAWMTDGTSAGTVLAPTATPTPAGEGSPTPTPTGPRPRPLPSLSVVLNGVVIFGFGELYESDANGGAKLLKNINNTPAGSYPYFLTSLGDTLFFFADDGIHGNELWRSDGTAGDTVLVKDINAGPAGSLAVYPAPTVLGDTLFFVANDGVHGSELWRSDGSDGGTSLVKDIDPGPADGLADYPYSYGGRELPVLNDTLFFAGGDPEGGFELWRSDGTADGTLRVKDIDPGPVSSNPSQFVAAGGMLFFVADDGVHGRELWRTDGSAEGTQLVKDIAAGAYGAGPYGLTASRGQLYFFSLDTSVPDAAPAALWKSDGTAEGTVVVKGVPASPTALLAVDRTLFFLESDQYGERRVLWRSDATSAGTVPLKSATPPGGNFIAFVSAATDILYFGIAGPAGNELWKTDGTQVGTVLVKRFDTPTVDALRPLATVGDSLIFSVENGDGLTLWKSDGTADGTVRLPDTSPALRVGLYGSAVAGSRLYLTANDGLTGTEPWALILSGVPPTPSPTAVPTSVCGDVCDGRACIVPGSGGAGNCVAGVDRCVCLGEVAPTLTPSPTPSVTPSATPAPPACVGDCDGNGEVTVDELVRGVDITLDVSLPEDCAAMSCRGVPAVTVDCLVEAVDAALNGCPATPSRSPSPMLKLPSPTPTPE